MSFEDLIKQIFNAESKQYFQVLFSGTSALTEGYLGDINFFQVKYKEKGNDQEEVLNLVMKSSTAELKKNLPQISELYFKEILVYSKIFPELAKFELKNKITTTFDNYPKYFGSISTDVVDGIIFENLRESGYSLHDRKVPLNLEHLKITLRAYAKIHATSVAFNENDHDEFAKIISTTNFVKERFEDPEGFPKLTVVFINTILGFLKEQNKNDLHKQLEEHSKNDLSKQILDLLRIKTGLNVVSHIDGWNNNYMFKYEDDDVEDVKIIDWQMVDLLNSPVYDISHFLFNCASIKDLNNLDLLLEHYHLCFSQHLSNFGCDPNKLFPYSTLKEHWEQFKVFGFVHMLYVLKQSYWDEADAPEVCELNDWATETDKIVIKDERYYERLFGVVDHYLNYKL